MATVIEGIGSFNGFDDSLDYEHALAQATLIKYNLDHYQYATWQERAQKFWEMRMLCVKHGIEEINHVRWDMRFVQCLSLTFWHELMLIDIERKDLWDEASPDGILCWDTALDEDMIDFKLWEKWAKGE